MYKARDEKTERDSGVSGVSGVEEELNEIQNGEFCEVEKEKYEHSPAKTMNPTETQGDIEADESTKETAAPSEMNAKTQQQTEERNKASENGVQTHELNDEMEAFSGAQLHDKPDMELRSNNISEGRTKMTGSCLQVQTDSKRDLKTM